MKKWIGLLIVLSVFIFSIKPSYARFVDKKEKTLSSVKLSSPKDDIAISVPSESVSFESTSNKISLPVSIENNSTYTFKQLDVNVDSVQMGSSNVDNWKDYYNITNLPTLSNDNLLFPSKKENISVDKYKKQFSVTITVNNKIPSDTFKFTLSLKFTSIGGAVITKNVVFSIVPKSITSDNLNLTGQQNIDFSKSTSEWQGTSKTGIGESTPWTLTNNTGIELTGLNISVIRAKAYSSTENANETDISNSWQDYFKVIFGKNAIEDGTYVKTVSATPGSKNEFYISAKQLKDASAYRKFVLTIAVTCGNDPNLSITKDVNITPRTTGINNDLPGDLGDLGIAGYFHIFAKDSVSYSVSQENDINIVTKNASMNVDFKSQGLINYFANSLSVNTQVVSATNSKFIFGNSVNYSNIKFTNPPIIMKDAVDSKYIDIDSEFTKLTSLSNKINDSAKNISALLFNNPNNQQIDVTSSDNKDYVLLKLPISYLCNDLTSLNIVNSTNKVVIINVYDNTNLTEVSITPEIKYNGTSSPQSARVLWNFSMSAVNKLKIENSFVGAILAPNMSVDVESSGHVRGGIIAQNVAISSSTGRIELPAFHLS